MRQPGLFEIEEPDEPLPPDQAAREFAIDPANDVVLEASAGTGKTQVLVDRYVRLMALGVEPRHVLAMTFTRKAAAEMRERVLAELERRAALDKRLAARQQALREQVSDIQISTIDAFCFGLLREFPLEAGVDPAFQIADETEVGRFAAEALELTLRAVRGLVEADDNVRLLLVRVKSPVLRDTLASLLDRRHVLLPAVASFVKRQAGVESPAQAAAAFVERVQSIVRASPDRRALIDDGPVASPEFRWLRDDLVALDDGFPEADLGRVQQLRRRLERYFLTQKGDPRQKIGKQFEKTHFPSPDAQRRHGAAVKAVALQIHGVLEIFDRDINALLARGLLRVLRIAVDRFERLLEEHAVLDFAAMLGKAVALLEQQEEFARSRLKLQSRYHHVLVDEFQDTSRLQWRLVELLIDAWGEGEGPEGATSIFVVGDRKQSIYRFRHAEVMLLDEAARKIEGLRPARRVRQAIVHSFRAVPELLAFVNALSEDIQRESDLEDRFRYEDADRFPVPAVGAGARRDGEPVLGVIAQRSVEACAEAVAAEVSRLLRDASVRDRTGSRGVRPDDIAILFRSRAGHRFFEDALERRGVRTYVYKGLGFFDAPEVQDLQALIRYLAKPESNLRAAEFLRSRFVRLSDDGLARLAPAFADALRSAAFDVAGRGLDAVDAALLERAWHDVASWLSLTDRMLPSDLIEQVMRESAYALEIGGRRRDQARENLKKVRALVRRVENRGYATVGRLADYLSTLKAGEETNAVIEASGCVKLMTIHAAKGLEFPIVFLVNVHSGTAGAPAISVIDRGEDGEPEVAIHGTSQAVRLERERDEEESRRLLYVAATRARDRLYFAGEIDEKSGKLREGGRSLASLFSGGFREMFQTAAASLEPEVEWRRATATFAFRVCRPSVSPATGSPAGGVTDREAPVDLRPIVASRSAGSAVGIAASLITADAAVATRHAATVDRLTGTLAHRLFQQRGSPADGLEALAEAALRSLRPEEAVDVDVDDRAALAAHAARLFSQIANRPDVQAAMAAGEALYEVPFSLRAGGGTGEIVRGTIDCVIASDAGPLIVLEFKTGAPRPEHEAQLAIYVEALGAAVPNRAVEGRLVYP